MIQVVLVTSYYDLWSTVVVRIVRHGLVNYLVCANSCRSYYLSILITEVVDLSCLYFFLLFVGRLTFFSVRLCAARGRFFNRISSFAIVLYFIPLFLRFSFQN